LHLGGDFTIAPSTDDFSLQSVHPRTGDFSRLRFDLDGLRCTFEQAALRGYGVLKRTVEALLQAAVTIFESVGFSCDGYVSMRGYDGYGRQTMCATKIPFTGLSVCNGFVDRDLKTGYDKPE
jgi:hypothetical protein